MHERYNFLIVTVTKKSTNGVNFAYIRYFDSWTILETSRANYQCSQFDRSAPRIDDSRLWTDYLDPWIHG